MFDALKSLGAVTSLLKNKDKIAEAVARVHENLERHVVTVEAPDKSVRVECNAKGKPLSLTVAPELLAQAGRDEAAQTLLQRTIVGAIQAAQQRGQALMQAEIEREANALGVPELAKSPELRRMLGG